MHSWNKSCNTCSKQKPILLKAKKEFQDVIFMNFEQNKSKNIANLLKIDYWTTIVIYKGNDELAREIGLYKENDIYNLIKKVNIFFIKQDNIFFIVFTLTLLILLKYLI